MARWRHGRWVDRQLQVPQHCLDNVPRSDHCDNPQPALLTHPETLIGIPIIEAAHLPKRRSLLVAAYSSGQKTKRDRYIRMVLLQGPKVSNRLQHVGGAKGDRTRLSGILSLDRLGARRIENVQIFRAF